MAARPNVQEQGWHASNGEYFITFFRYLVLSQHSNFCWVDLERNIWLCYIWIFSQELEEAVRQLASSCTDRTLVIDTGTIGVLELPDREGIKWEVFLEPKTKRLPVPGIVWKVPTNMIWTYNVLYNIIYLTDLSSYMDCMFLRCKRSYSQCRKSKCSLLKDVL